ncbi:MAG TPA: trigger factor [Armatimonadota bacterium]|jgi:trigger factor
MQVAVERRPGSIVALTVTVEPAVIEERMEQLFRKHAQRIRIPGFRPGKAPRAMLEQQINRGALLQDAIEAVINTTYKEALREQNIEPLEQGEIADLNTAEDLTLTYTVTVSIRPEVTLPPYTDLEVKHPATQVGEEQVNAEIERLRERTADFAEITEEGIQKGDYVTIDYTMTVNGEPYPEGDTTGYPLEVGTDTFFPELNESLLGVKQGDTTTLTTDYPENYSNKDLAGKKAEFTIIVQQVRRVTKPEASDEWVQSISQGALNSLDELRERVKNNLQLMAAEADHDQIRNELVRKVVENAELDIPELMAEEQFEHQMHDLEHRLSHERMSMEEYAEMSGRTIEQIENEQRILARDMVRRSLVLQEIARRENITVTDEDVDAMLTISAREGQNAKELRKDLEKSGRMQSLESRLFHEKVLSYLEGHAKIDTSEGAAEEPKAEEAVAEKPAKKASKPRKKATAEPAPAEDAE